MGEIVLIALCVLIVIIILTAAYRQGVDAGFDEAKNEFHEIVVAYLLDKYGVEVLIDDGDGNVVTGRDLPPELKNIVETYLLELD